MKKHILPIILCLWVCSSALAQERIISGSVKTNDGSPTPGVNVIVKGTLTGTTTDASGNYNLSVPNGTSVLVFSFIGLRTIEIEIGNRSVVDVTMENDVTQLSEVVVTGYTTQNKR